MLVNIFHILYIRCNITINMGYTKLAIHYLDLNSDRPDHDLCDL